MASTTLITFMLQAPTKVFSVDILGSWDNFSKPYQLQRDRRTGPGQWRGCHKFENITCDGDTLNASTSRDGGLKMGGTYWYYYVLDGDLEYHDPAEPATNLCPLLPGQIVNVLEVPVQENVLFGGSRNLSSSSLDSAVFTLDPQDKYLSSGVRRASTTSAVHTRKARFPATTRPMARAQRNASSETVAVPQTSERTKNVPVLERQRSLLSVFHRMRQTRSAGSNAKSDRGWSRKIFSRAGKLTAQGAPDPVPQTAKQIDRAPSLSPAKVWDGSELPNRLPSTAVTMYRAPTALLVHPENNNAHPSQQLSSGDHNQLTPRTRTEQRFEYGVATSPGGSSDSEGLILSSNRSPTKQLRDTLSYPVSTAADNIDVMALSDQLDQLDLAPDVAVSTKMPFDVRTTILDQIRPTDLVGSFELDFCSSKYGYAESLASGAASPNFSPCLSLNTTHSGLVSPCHLSQPETPNGSEFGDEPPLDFPRTARALPMARPPARADTPILPRPQRGDMQTSLTTLGGFQGYSLPGHDHGSVPTIRKLPSVTFKMTDNASPFIQEDSKQDLVHSWNDGSEHPMTALGELVDDLGYLGKIII